MGCNHYCHCYRNFKSRTVYPFIYLFTQHLPVASQPKAKHWIAHMRLHHQAPLLANRNNSTDLAARLLCSLRPLQKHPHPHQVRSIICFTKRTCYTGLATSFLEIIKREILLCVCLDLWIKTHSSGEKTTNFGHRVWQECKNWNY